MPDWTGADRPRSTPEVTYELSKLNSIATYHLLTTEDDHQDSQHIPDTNTGSYGGSEYLWPGTMVYDGKVYDNISYRARGGVWRYAMGKNMWKFDFNRNDRFQAKDDYGRDYQEKWDKLNFSAIIQQGNFDHRGEQGLFESVGFKLFNLAGVESPNTHYVHFRVVDTAQESTDDQYTGDFQGLYLAIEQPDGNMLEEHGLPDGNFYKIEGHNGDSNNQGPTQVSDGSDVDDFIAAYQNGNPDADWWEANLDLERYYSYRTIVDGIHHYDMASGKNYYYYHNPETGKFQVHPWDLDLTWANNMFGSGNHDFVSDVYRRAEFRDDADNRTRELLDLLYNEEQTGLLIDEMASHVYTPGELSWVDADRAMWDFNPILRSSYVNGSKAGNGRFYQQAATDDFPGMAQLMKDYVEERVRFITIRNRSEDDAPITPTITYTGLDNYPLNGLAFQTSDFADPMGDTFAAMEWRIAEISDPDNPQFGQPIKYEITPTYESGELTTFAPSWTPPVNQLTAGALYRVRVRMQNQDGNWSHWSEPEQFVAATPVAANVVDSLRVTELHYHPTAPTRAEIDEGFNDQDDFEFIELMNVGTETISLANTSFEQVEIDGETQGLTFQFPESRELAPGERIVVVENIDAFNMRYGLDLALANGIAGQWSGGLGNGGEFLRIVDDGTVVQEFTYDDAWHPTTDGDGFSLEIVNAGGELSEWSSASGWQPSASTGGTPGDGGTAALLGDFDLNGEVGFSDFLILSANFGLDSKTAADGDTNDDKMVDFTDFLVLSANFGKKA